MVIPYFFFPYQSTELLTESLWGGEKAGAAGPELGDGCCCASSQRREIFSISYFLLEQTAA